MNPKRVRGQGTSDKDDDESRLINTIQTRDLTVDKDAVSQLHSRKKVVPKTRFGIWGTMKFLLKILWILCLCIPTSSASTAAISERYLSMNHLGEYKSEISLEESLGSLMDPRYRRCKGDLLHSGVKELIISQGNYHLGEWGFKKISQGSSMKPRCRRDIGCHLHPGMQRSRLYLGRHHLGGTRSPRCQGDARYMRNLCENCEKSRKNRATSCRRKSRNLCFGKYQYSRDLAIYPMDTEVPREDQEVSRTQEIRRPRRPETWQFRDQNSRKSEEAESFEEPWDPG